MLLQLEHDGLCQRSRVDSASTPLFDSFLLLVAWSLWKERNGRVFGRPPSDVQAVICAVLQEGEEWALGGFVPLVALSELWLQHLGVM